MTQQQQGAEQLQKAEQLQNAEQLAATLTAAGALRSRAWIQAFAATPRHVFVPRFISMSHGWCAVADGDEGYLSAVYSDTPLVTQLDGDVESWAKLRRQGLNYQGRQPSSSSSQPSVMAAMLAALDVQEGHTVLEVGTGTGYNTALLCHRLGSEAVTSVDVDPALVGQAKARLHQLGYGPRLVALDATQTVPAGRYDRLIATVAMPAVPAEWIARTRPGGRILVNLHSDLYVGGLFLLTVGRDGAFAEGRIAVEGTFMPTLGNQPPMAFELHEAVPDDGPEQPEPTALRGEQLDNLHFRTFLALHLRDAQLHTVIIKRAPTQYWLLGRDASWASQTHQAHRTEQGQSTDPARLTGRRGRSVVTQGGPRRLWTLAEQAYETWRRLGEPDQDRLGLTVTAAGAHRFWVVTPDNPYRWRP